MYQKIVTDHIRNAFVTSKEELQLFKYLGLNISQTEYGFLMHQKEYKKKIEVAEINQNQKVHKLLPTETQQP